MQQITKSLLFSDGAYLESGGTRGMFLTEEYHSKDFSLFMSILKHQPANEKKVHICLNLPAIGRIGGTASTLNSTPKSGIRNVSGQKRENAVLSLQTPEPMFHLHNVTGTQTKDPSPKLVLPVHTRVLQSTDPALQTPGWEYRTHCQPQPALPYQESFAPQSMGFALSINIIFPIQWGLFAHLPAPCSQKTHSLPLPPHLKWNVSPCVLKSQSLLEAMSSNC